MPGDSEEPRAPLFSPSSTTAFRVALFVLVLAIASVPVVLLAWERAPYVTGELDPKMQPVKFDHRHHVRDDGIACEYCHNESRHAPTAGMPALSVCMGCHAQIWLDSPELAALRTSYFANAPFAWQRVTRLPHFVFFNHSIHVSKGVGCATCHGRVDLMGQVYAIRPFTMAFCLDCHRNPERFLRPLREVMNMEWEPSEPQERLGRRLQSGLQVQPGLDCTTCHR